MLKRSFYFILIFTFSLPGILQGQEIEPIGYFIEDSVKIGEETVYSLSVSYPRGTNLVFPDSLYDFFPYELNRKVEFPTRSDSLVSHDSTIYYLSTFEIEVVQKLALPVFVIQNGDSVKYFTNEDSLLLDELIQQLPDSVALKENSSYSNVNLDFNYPYLIFGLSIFALIVIATILIFGKKIARRIKLYRLRKGHEKFQNRFNQLLAKSNLTKSNYEHILLVWKKYMEKLDNTPYTKLTTKEITKIQPNSDLSTNLKNIDRSIYGRSLAEDLPFNFNGLKDYAFQRLNTKMNQIKNVK